MTRSFRILAAVLLALLLPVQGWAAACAQICARVGEERRAAMMAAAQQNESSEEEDAMHDHCGKSEMGAGKCCQSHVFVVQLPLLRMASAAPSFERTLFVARWTNFIPEQPSPPPIPSGKVA